MKNREAFTIYTQHLNELQNVIDYCKGNNITLYAVIFPELMNIDYSNELYVNDIVDYFEANKITTINVSQLVMDLPLESLIVNNQDSHPSKLTHEIVGSKLAEIINKETKVNTK